MNARDRWNRIYKEDNRPGSVAAVLTRHAGLLPQGGRALDIACGTGANARFLADRGMEVDAWDISDVVIKALEGFHPRVHPRAIDISADSLVGNKGEADYDLILTCHYLDAALAPAIRDATRPGGLIIYQTFTAAKIAAIGPDNPGFLLQPGDLESFVKGCRILAADDGSQITDSSHPLAGRACILAQKPQ